MADAHLARAGLADRRPTPSAGPRDRRSRGSGCLAPWVGLHSGVRRASTHGPSRWDVLATAAVVCRPTAGNSSAVLVTAHCGSSTPWLYRFGQIAYVFGHLREGMASCVPASAARRSTATSGSARAARARPGRADDRRRTRRRRPRRARTSGSRPPPSPGCWSVSADGPGTRTSALRLAGLPPAVDARAAQRRAARGAGPAQRARPADALRAQLQRGAAAAAGRGERPGHGPAVARVRRAGADPAGAGAGRRRAARDHPGVSRPRSWQPLSVCFSHPAPARSPPTSRCSGRGCSSTTRSPGWSSTPAISTREHDVRSAAPALRRAVPPVTPRPRRRP